MSERFPWEEGEPRAEAAHPREENAEPGEENAPPPVEPDVQPDGDPREAEDTTPQAEVSEVEAAPEPEVETSPPAPPARAQGEPARPVPRERPVARKEYYSIGEVSDLVGLPAHVLRYWESQFPVLNPSKNRSGNRAYQRKEIRLILLVKHLLYEEKYTVEGAKAKLDQLRRGGTLHEHTAQALDTQTVALLREEVAQLREILTLATP